MEVASSVSLPDSSSSSDSCLCSPNRDFGSHRCCYKHGSRSTSRPPRCFERGYSPVIDHSHGRDYRYLSPDRNNNYRDRQYNPGYYCKRYNNSNGFSRIGAIVKMVTQININRQFQGRYQGDNHRNNPNNYNNEGNGWKQGSQRGGKNQYRNQ